MLVYQEAISKSLEQHFQKINVISHTLYLEPITINSSNPNFLSKPAVIHYSN